MYWREVNIIAFSSLVLVLCASTTPFAQFTSKTDSLKSLLEQSEGLQKIELLHILSDQIQRSDLNSAIQYTRKALELSEEREQERFLAESHRKLGRLLSIRGKHVDGLEHLLEANMLYKKLGEIRKIALTTENLGAFYRRQNDYQNSLNYYYKAYELRQKIDNREGISNTLLNIGVIHQRLRQTEESADFYKQALAISLEKNDLSRIAITATQLGNLYADQGDLDAGLEYMNQALEAAEDLPGHHARATILLNISSMYNSAESYKLALNANRKALKLASSLGNESLTIWAQKNMAEIYSNLNDFQSAEGYLLKALRSQQSGAPKYQMIDTRNQLARTYFEMENYEDAGNHAQKALAESVPAKAFEPGIESLHILTDVYKQTGNYEAATSAQERLSALKDSVFNREQARQVAEKQTRFDSKQKEQEIALLRKEAEQDQLFQNALLSGLMLIVIITFLIYNRQKLRIKKNRIELENTRLKEEQLTSDLEHKNRALTNHSLHLVQKNETMKELKDNIGEIKQSNNGGLGKELQKLENMVDYSFNLDEDWKEFQHYFEEVHSGFFDALKTKHPALTPNELRLAALAKLNLSIKETATIMGITPNSVKTARYRLRKKLKMETKENLTEFMMEIEKTSA